MSKRQVTVVVGVGHEGRSYSTMWQHKFDDVEVMQLMLEDAAGSLVVPVSNNRWLRNSRLSHF